MKEKIYPKVQIILFEIVDCAIFYTDLHELFCQFISWTNWVNSGKFMGNCWISCHVMADMKTVNNYLIIINLYPSTFNFLLKIWGTVVWHGLFFSGWDPIKQPFWNFLTFKVNDSKLEDKKKETFITEAEKKLQEAKKNKSKLRILLFF